MPGKEDYQFGTLVLAKVRGFPPWPAEVCDPAKFDQEPKEDKLFVLFFQPRQIRFCAPEEVTLFTGEAKEAAIQRTKTKNCLADFKTAVHEILEEEKKRQNAEADKSEDERDEEPEEPEEPEETEEPDDVEEEDSEEYVQEPAKKLSRKRGRPTRKASPQARGRAKLSGKTQKHEIASGSGKKVPLDATGNLFATVRKGSTSESVAAAWVERYMEDPNKGVSELLNFLFQACGARINLEPEDPSDDTDVDDVVQNLVAAAKDGDVDDLVGSKSKETKDFKRNLLQFWHALVLECQETVLFDENLFNKLMSYVIALACTSPRTFRHVATLVALQLVSSFVTVATFFIETRETVQRQLNAEKKKKGVNERVAALEKSLEAVNEKVATVEGMMRNLFTGVFMHRYRDVDSEIRVACISSLGVWIGNYPSLFLQDLYLKYIGWTLNDKVPTVRLSSISALCALYENDDFIPALGLFTERFLDRMVELVEDIDIEVAVKALDLLQQLMKHQPIGEERILPFYELLFDESPQIRHAVGKIIYELRVAPAGRFSGVGTSGRGSKGKKGSDAQIRSILQLMADYSSNPSMADYMVDALGNVEALQDWKCISRMLLNDQSEDSLSEEDANYLLRILTASVKRAVGERLVPSSDGRKFVATKTMKASFEANKRELTSAFMKALPQLLKKYLADGEKVASLVDIVLCLELEIFSINRQETSFSTILQLLKEAFFKHAEEQILHNCVKALSFCAQEGHAELKDVAQAVLNEAATETMKKLDEAVQHATAIEEDVEHEYSLRLSLRRFAQLQLVTNIGKEESFTSIAALLDKYSSLDDETVGLSLFNLFLQLCWSYTELDFEHPSETSMASLATRRGKLMEHLQVSTESVLDSEDTGSDRLQLIEQIIHITSDFWCLFSKSKLHGSVLEELEMEPTEHELKQYWKLCTKILSIPETENVDDGVGIKNSAQSREVVMTAVAKLVVYDMVPKNNLAAEIISHLTVYGKGVADVVKTLCNRLKEDKSTDHWDLYHEALKKAYQRHLEEADNEDSEQWASSKSLQGCKELANRLSATYVGFGRAGNRDKLVKIVRLGLVFAFNNLPRQLLFLEAGVIQFALKLSAGDIQNILEDAVRRVEGVNIDEDPSAWRPYVAFTDQLKEKLSKASPKIVVNNEELPRRGRPRKGLDVTGKRLSFGGRHSDEEDNEPTVSGSLNSDSDEEDNHARQRNKRKTERSFSPEKSNRVQGHKSTSNPETRYVPKEAPQAKAVEVMVGRSTLQYSRKRRAAPESLVGQHSSPSTRETSQKDASGSMSEIMSPLEPAGKRQKGVEGTETAEGKRKGKEMEESSQIDGMEGTEKPRGEDIGDSLERQVREGDGDIMGTEELFYGTGTATEEQLPRPPAQRPVLSDDSCSGSESASDSHKSP